MNQPFVYRAVLSWCDPLQKLAHRFFRHPRTLELSSQLEQGAVEPAIERLLWHTEPSRDVGNAQPFPEAKPQRQSVFGRNRLQRLLEQALRGLVLLLDNRIGNANVRAIGGLGLGERLCSDLHRTQRSSGRQGANDV